MGRVSGKVALITGAASGLGKADAWRLAEEGATVVLTDIDDAGQNIADEIQNATGQIARFYHQDVTDETRWKAIIEAVEKELGGLDVLVNNAGIVIVATPEETTLKQFRLANAVMSESVFLGCQAAIPAMKRRGGGSIINMSSVASHLGYPVFFAYTAAKGAVRSMTKSLAVHCQMNGYNIRCNSIHAGAIDTPMLRSQVEVTPDLEAQLLGFFDFLEIPGHPDFQGTDTATGQKIRITQRSYLSSTRGPVI